MIVVLFYFPTPIDCCVVCSKVMFLGVVAKPIESRNFDGKIFIERVAKYEAYKKSVTSEQFSDDGAFNSYVVNAVYIRPIFTQYVTRM